MKKIFAGILTLVYLLASSGIAMQTHYCMGKKAGEDFYAVNKKDKCSKCGMKEKKKGCCHDEYKFSKLEDSHKNVFNNIHFEIFNSINLIESPIFNWQLSANEPIASLSNHSPPNYTQPSACILNCVFRI